MSESDEEIGESFDLYDADPVFETKEDLATFLASCNIQMVDEAEDKSEEGKICYNAQKKIEKKCSCGKCDDIWSEDFQHICCHQMERYYTCQFTFI